MNRRPRHGAAKRGCGSGRLPRLPHPLLRKRRVAAALLALLALLAATPLRADDPAPPPKAAPCTAPEHRQFDFRIGSWRVSRPDGALAGHNRIERILGGCALHENWTGAKGGTGQSLNAYDPARGRWHQTWVDGEGALLLDGALDAQGRMVLESPPAESGAHNRITWSKDGDGVRQLWEASEDRGKTWKTLFDGRYQREP